MIPPTNLDLFAGIPVADYAAARSWYERLLGEAQRALEMARQCTSRPS